MQAQAKQGFAHVPEEAAKSALIDLLGAELPENTKADDGYDYGTEVRLAAMAKVMPGWGHSDATKALHIALLLENPEALGDPLRFEETMSNFI